MAKEKKFITCDGNAAAAHIAYMFSEVSCIYPITPSSPMAENVDEWAAKGRKNMFGETVRVIEMQSEAGAAGAVHGSMQAGALTTTYTASQGLLLMIPNMYKIAGELLPCVFHVSARALAAHALNIFGDHADVYAARQTGFAMLAAGSVQEVMDLSAVSHLSAIKGRVPFLSFFDGFRTSHEIQKIEALEMEELRGLVDMKAIEAFRHRSLNPDAPVTRGTAQNPDIYFQGREACNKFYEALPDIVSGYMNEVSRITGRKYRPFDYYGAPDAENIIIAMGSVTDTIREVIDYKVSKGEKVGMIAVHLYRPFSAKYFMEAFPASVKRITVLDRTKEPGANGDPLYLDVKDIFYGKANAPLIIGGRYGMGSKDVTPGQIIGIYKNMAMNEPKSGFTVGITDDVTFKSLPMEKEVKVTSDATYEAKFYGLGSDGTVGANKNSIKIIGEATDKYCQAYFAYDSKKSGGFTASHLRFGDEPIRSTYLITTPDFVACHVPAYIHQYDVLKGLKKGGSFLLNSLWDAEETVKHLPNSMKRYMAENEINFYIINGTKLGQELGLGNRTNTIMQSAFFKITNVIPYELAMKEMKAAIVKSYGTKGEAVINMNNAAVDAGGLDKNLQKVAIPADWKNLPDEAAKQAADRPEFIRKVVDVMNAQKGDDLPVSAFNGIEDGTFPCGTSKYEKRGIAVHVPEWQADNCIQCNQCAYVCPHAAIRPFLMTDAEVAAAPAGTVVKPATGKELAGYHFRMQVSPLDCTGCGNCADICISKTKALVMKPLESQEAEIGRWLHMDKKVGYKQVVEPNNVKNSQFVQPLFEFSGACAGCGETPYIKLITQLFGERMMVANATGCTSIYGASAPSTPYCTNYKSGRGPSWANSLFEDNAEFGFGMAEGANRLRERVKRLLEEHASALSADTNAAAKAWIAGYADGDKTIALSDALAAALSKDGAAVAKEILSLKQYFTKKSQWIFGGDGWGYDIGYGGVDHVLASGQDVNILVVDTEVYSNTGGQSSKSTPTGAVAKFAAGGKRVRKKDLGAMAMSYGYVYVAQVAMGANQAQYMKALKEAEAYPGPSLIIAYAPCINHGLKASMGKSQEEEKKAVECGYWQLYRYNPQLEEEGKNPFLLDSKEPDYSQFRAFLMGEVRFNSLLKAAPADAERLFSTTEENAKWRYDGYKRRAAMKYGE
ncbi:MAG: pyruvate:ferredoxin (flavodoxin) oxidoreductase [Culturomica sp.]|jgi:pyruvate-ferredoxin/flavodoxin oxidoreductase|nr:pyruvate:ferredoxin (flavodoxin) oxidoreductase [Culturomica sp.]